MPTIYETLPALPVWDDEGQTISLDKVDSVVDAVLADHGVEIDWSTGDVEFQVADAIAVGANVEPFEIHRLLRCVAHAAFTNLAGH